MECCWQLWLALCIAPPTWAGDRLLSVCMKTKHHKREPGPEDQLYEEVQRPELVQGWKAGPLGRSGKGHKVVSEPSSTRIHVVS